MQILSTYPRRDGEDQYRFLSGTSMATPFVAGTAAAMLNANPDLTGFELKNLIKNSATVLGQFASRVRTGSRLHSNNSKVAAQSTQSTGEQPKSSGGSFAGDDSAGIDNAGGGCGLVSNNPPPSSGLMIPILALPIILLLGLRLPRVRELFV